MPAASWDYPEKQGLYDPKNETAACGVGFIVNIDGVPSAKIIRDAETMASRMKHRGACSCDNDTGDGAGVLAGIPHSFYQEALGDVGITLPAPGRYATGIIYMDPPLREDSERKFEELLAEYSCKVIYWRTVPTDSDSLGQVARSTEPLMRQVFITSEEDMEESEFKIKIWMTRKRATHTIPEPGRRFYICSLSPLTIVYKGQLTSDQLWTYFSDLASPKFETYLALVHTRFSTNTFPTWERAHPLRMMAHNGEINTLKGNVNFMKAREGVMEGSLYGDDISKMYPVVEPNLSDSGAVDCCLEFLVMAGNRSLPEVPFQWSA